MGRATRWPAGHLPLCQGFMRVLGGTRMSSRSLAAMKWVAKNRDCAHRDVFQRRKSASFRERLFSSANFALGQSVNGMDNFFGSWSGAWQYAWRGTSPCILEL